MKKVLFILLGFSFLAPFCHADVRWCSLLGKSDADHLFYPRIARAARLEGAVVSRITYKPSGQVSSVETVFGPLLLARSVDEQLKTWTLKTNAMGNELCQSLTIFDFSIDRANSGSNTPNPYTAPGILRISIMAEPLILDSSPTVAATKRRFLLRPERGVVFSVGL